MTARTAILHIGVTKTGSSAIQAWLAAHREALREAGYHLPVSVGFQNHERLIAVAEGLATDRLRRRFARELAALPDGVHSVILTSEAFGAHLTTPERVAPLKALLDQHVGAYRVIAYLRRQDEHAVSSYSTAMRAGLGRRGAVLPAQPRDYAALLDAWAGVFGRDAIQPRLFARGLLQDDDVVADFLAAAGIPLPPGAATQAGPSNPSLRPAAQAFLERLANHARRSGAVAGDLRELPDRARLIALLDAQFAGPGMLPARAEAQAFLARARASNERVRAAWFPDRATLFPEDFSRYPETAPAPPDAEAILEVALASVLGLLRGDPAEQAAAPDRDAVRAAARAEIMAARRQGRRRQGNIRSG